jgi:hypothetical protein
MSIELPSEIVWFLNLIGVNWPAVNEDAVRQYAGHVRTFASNVQGTHQAATATITQMGQNYQGASYEQLVSTWARMSDGHMTELVDACGVVATAMDAAADAIVAAKGAALAELAVMVASFVADQAAAVATFGLAEAAEAAVVAAAKKLINDLIQQLEQHVLGEVVEKAVVPLEDTVKRAVDGLVYNAAQSAAGAASAGASFMVHPGQLLPQIQEFTGHAQQVASHATQFASDVSAVNFSD